jgi:mono/diheme cytochrome c family protein
MKLRMLLLVSLVFVLASAQGDPKHGAKVFAKMRCDTCHAVATTTGTGSQHPLPDLSTTPPAQIANMIVKRADVAHDALFDDIAMSSAASHMTVKELDDVVAYLRSVKPSTAPDDRVPRP